ncbi:MAG TPA: hypothetical protein VKA84_04305 [Gemmatimonadaceae bacterium]|nr:hypothetical protein [Gemmatimonadaceae bacterium]
MMSTDRSLHRPGGSPAPDPVSGDGMAVLSAGLSSALVSSAREHHSAVESLRVAVCKFVQELHRQEVPLPEMILVMRRFVSELRDTGRIESPLLGADDGLMVQLVAWCEEFGG